MKKMRNQARSSDFAYLTVARSLEGDSQEDTRLLRKMLNEAERYAVGHDWCQSIERKHFGMGVGGVVAVFLFKIRPKFKNTDNWLWVVVGDLPPACLAARRNPSARHALGSYIREMRRWIDAVEKGKDTRTLIPVNVRPTRGNARRLKRRLDFIQNEILPFNSPAADALRIRVRG